jgi:Tfp pilus assembly PilM family ATPase
MVRSIGIDAGDHAVKVVELDGSYKKVRLLRASATSVLAAAADETRRPELVAEAVRAAVGSTKVEPVLAQPCRDAVLRTIELPFKGAEAIRKVVKSEIEGEIYTHTVDDMVVDFLEMGDGTAGGTKVLVASVPKAGLKSQLEALADQGIEPDRVDLDTMALWRVAHWAGAFAAPAADAGAVPVPGQQKPITAVVDVGARSIKVILVEGEQLVEMRALRLGEAVVAEQVAREFGVALDRAREVVPLCLASGDDQEVEAPALPLAPVEGDAAAPEVETELRTVAIEHERVAAAHTAYQQRLARELTRFLTATGLASRIQRTFVTGGASRAPGTKEMLNAVFGGDVQELDVLGNLQHDLDAEAAAELAPQLAVAIGMALLRFGGPAGLQFRREDLALMRGFERVKFPLAIACMVALLALFVHGNRRSIELRNLEYELGRQYVDPQNPKALVFYGMLNHMFASKWFENPAHFRIEQSAGKDYTYKDLVDEVLSKPVHQRLQIVHARLKSVADQKQKESGVYEEVSLESGLAVLVRWAEILKRVEPQLGRYLVPRIDLDMKAPNRRLDFTIAFRGDDFRSRMSVLERAIEADYQSNDSPFAPPQRSDELVKELPFSDAVDRGVQGAYFRVSMRIKDAFAPFGPSASPSVGSAAPAGREGLAPNQVASAAGEGR